MSARPDFQILLYPGSLTEKTSPNKVADEVAPDKQVPPTFIAQAMNDPAVHFETTLAYLEALKQTGIPAEIHLYAEGGHGFGIRSTNLPVTGWPELAARWLRTIHMLGDVNTH